MNERTLEVSSIDVRTLTLNALCIALTFLATAFINIRLPIAANGGLIHLGNVVLFAAAVLFGRRTGALAGGIGMALFDLVSGWTLWAPFTLVIVGLMGYTAGRITEHHKSLPFQLAAFTAALIIKILGYYAAEGIIYGNWIAPAASIPGNVIQILVGAIIAIPLIAALRKVGIENEV